MVGGLGQLERERSLDPGRWLQPQDRPQPPDETNWGAIDEREHQRHVVFLDIPEHEWLWRDFERFERAELRRLVWKLLRARRATTDYATLEQILHVLWKHRESARAMVRLEEAAKAGDQHAFQASLEEIEWRNCPPEDFVRATQLALEIGAHLTARQISAEGAKRYPEDPEILKYARVLAPPKVVSKNVPPDPARRANREWLKAHGGEYRGQWVAIRNGELLGVAESLRKLTEEVVDSKEGVLLTRAY